MKLRYMLMDGAGDAVWKTIRLCFFEPVPALPTADPRAATQDSQRKLLQFAPVHAPTQLPVTVTLTAVPELRRKRTLFGPMSSVWRIWGASLDCCSARPRFCNPRRIANEVTLLPMFISNTDDGTEIQPDHMYCGHDTFRFVMDVIP